MNRIKFKIYRIGSVSKYEDIMVGDDVYNKYHYLKDMDCIFEVEILSTGMIHMDIQKNGKQISNHLCENKEGLSAKGVKELINNAYYRLMKDNTDMLNTTNIKDMTMTQIEEHVKQLESKLNTRNDIDCYKFEKQKLELESFIFKLLECIGNNSQFNNLCKKEQTIKLFLAGGAITSVFSKKEINDYDLFFYTEHDFNMFTKYIVDDASIISETDRAITYNISGQVFQAIKLFGTPADIFDSFDYTINMAALPFEITEESIVSKDFIFSKSFLNDMMHRSLIFNPNTKYPINSLFRLKKYFNKGYEINSYEFMKLALTVNNLELKTVKDFKEQCIGLSADVMLNITKNLNKYDNDGFIGNPLEFFRKLDIEDIEVIL